MVCKLIVARGLIRQRGHVQKQLILNRPDVYLSEHEARTDAVGDKRFRSSRARAWVAFHPVQWAGTINAGLSVLSAAMVGGMLGSKSAPVR